MVTVALLRAITYSLLGVLYYTWNYWLDFLIYISIIPMIAIWLFSLAFLVEGPNFLFRKGRFAECQESIAFIAKINGKT